MHGHRRYHDEAERRQWQEPGPILKAIGMEVGKRFADIGCGDGFFSLPAARMAGEGGAVYGVDADAESLKELREKAERAGLINIFLSAGDASTVK